LNLKRQEHPRKLQIYGRSGEWDLTYAKNGFLGIRERKEGRRGKEGRSYMSGKVGLCAGSVQAPRPRGNLLEFDTPIHSKHTHM